MPLLEMSGVSVLVEELTQFHISDMSATCQKYVPKVPNFRETIVLPMHVYFCACTVLLTTKWGQKGIKVKSGTFFAETSLYALYITRPHNSIPFMWNLSVILGLSANCIDIYHCFQHFADLSSTFSTKNDSMLSNWLVRARHAELLRFDDLFSFSIFSMLSFNVM